MTATKAAIAAFRSALRDPARALAPDFTDRRAYFQLLWQYYSGSAFEDSTAWQTYRTTFGLYRKTRAIYNPTRRLVNFYVAQVYPGVLSTDAAKLPDGVPLAIPLTSDTDEDLRIAVAQFWQWSNWQSGNKLMVRYGGATGSVMVEVQDEVSRGKVTARVLWPGWVKDLVLDGTGNVKSYALEYETTDAEGKSYTYRKEVSGESFSYFRDDSPFTPEGRTASVEENPYGFVPAVWCKHLDEGGDWGAPAVSGSLGKIDELNELASHVSDAVHILIDSPGVLGSSGNVGKIEQKRAATAEDEYAAISSLLERTSRRLLLKGPPDTKWVPLVPNITPSEVEARIAHLYGEIEKDFPELKFWETARTMTTLSGVAVDKLSGDVKGRLGEVSANYDQQSVKLFGQAVAIAGFRLKEGREGWRNPTEQQRKFAEFDLTSYGKGQLDMEIAPRPLVPQTEDEAVSLQGKRLDNAKKADGIFSDDKVLEVAGIGDEQERKDMLAARTESEAQNGLTGIAARIAAQAQNGGEAVN